MIRPPPRPTLFPYTPLSRSNVAPSFHTRRLSATRFGLPPSTRVTSTVSPRTKSNTRTPGRSEEHTSELQSRQYLVCRLLLEKKKQKIPHLQVQYKQQTKSNP